MMQIGLNRVVLLGVLSFGETLFRIKGFRRSVEPLPRLQDVKSVLVGRLDERIGDFVLMTPFLRELRRNASQAWITLLVTPAVAELAVLCPYVNEVLVWDRVSRGACRSLRRYWQVLRLSASHLWARRFDLALLPVGALLAATTIYCRSIGAVLAFGSASPSGTPTSKGAFWSVKTGS